jgi:hypothetical protein
MALLLTGSTDLTTGISIPNAYTNANNMSYNKKRGTIDVMVTFYKDQASYTAGKDPIKREMFSLPVTLAELEATFIYVLVYTKLKALPLFLGSTDC